MIDFNEWKTEKRQEFTNMGKLKTTPIMMATVRHVTSSSGLRNFQKIYVENFWRRNVLTNKIKEVIIRLEKPFKS
jgi:hypothetical protein